MFELAIILLRIHSGEREGPLSLVKFVKSCTWFLERCTLCIYEYPLQLKKAFYLSIQRVHVRI